MKKLHHGLAAALAIGLAHGAAVAQPASPVAPPPAAVTPLADSLSGDAKKSYDDGKVLFKDRDFAGARIKFQLAYDAAKDPRLKWNIAACEKNLRHYARVQKLVGEYLAEGGDRLTADDRHEAEELLRVIEPFTARLRLDVNEPGASAYLDDVLLGATPFAEAPVVDLGVHKLRVHKDGFEDHVAEVVVGGSAEAQVTVKLRRSIHEGRLALRAPARSSVFVDGRLVAHGSYTATLPSGGHALRVTQPDMRTFQTDVLIEDNKTRTLDVTLDPEVKKGAGVPAWVWIVGGGVVAAGAATAIGIVLLQPTDPPRPTGTFNPGSADL